MYRLQNIADMLIRKPWILMLLLVSTLLIPAVLTQCSLLFDFSKTGQIGDTIGGITAPFIGMVGSLFLFLALHEQVVANRQLAQENTDQRNREEARRLHAAIDRLDDRSDSIPTWTDINQPIRWVERIDRVTFLLLEFERIDQDIDRLAQAIDDDAPQVDELRQRLARLYRIKCQRTLLTSGFIPLLIAQGNQQRESGTGNTDAFMLEDLIVLTTQRFDIEN